MTIEVSYSLVAGLGPGTVVLRFLLWKKQQQRPEIQIDIGVVGVLDNITLCKHYDKCSKGSQFGFKFYLRELLLNLSIYIYRHNQISFNMISILLREISNRTEKHGTNLRGHT